MRGPVKVVTVPVVVIRPIELFPLSVNHSALSGPTVMPVGRSIPAYNVTFPALAAMAAAGRTATATAAGPDTVTPPAAPASMSRPAPPIAPNALTRITRMKCLISLGPRPHHAHTNRTPRLRIGFTYLVRVRSGCYEYLSESFCYVFTGVRRRRTVARGRSAAARELQSPVWLAACSSRHRGNRPAL